MLQSSTFWDPHAPSQASLLWPPGVEVPPEAHPILQGTSNLGTSDPWVVYGKWCVCWGEGCVGACQQAFAPGFFSGNILAHRTLESPHPAYFTPLETEDWFLPSPKLLYLCEREKQVLSIYGLATHMVSINHI